MSPLFAGMGATASGAASGQESRPIKARIIEAATAALFETYLIDFYQGTTPHPDGRAAGDQQNELLDVQFQHDGTTYRALIHYTEA